MYWYISQRSYLIGTRLLHWCLTQVVMVYNEHRYMFSKVLVFALEGDSQQSLKNCLQLLSRLSQELLKSMAKYLQFLLTC